MLLMSLSAISCDKKSAENGSDNAVENSVGDESASDEIQPVAEPSLPVVIDFYATWCGPCKQLAPILEKMEEKYHENIIFKRVDIDQEPELVEKYGIASIPTLVFENGYGKEMGRQVGLISEAELDKFLEEFQRY